MILIKNLDLIATFNDAAQVIKGGNILIDEREIREIGPTADLGLHPEEVIDGRGKIALPGFINTHHHFFQQLTRAFPSVHCAGVLDWLVELYPIWGQMDEEAMYYASLLSIAELLLTGCTTTSDMTYLYPYGRTNLFDIEVQAAKEMGIRFHPCRAALPAMEADIAKKLETQGYPIHEWIEKPEQTFSECERVIQKYHQTEEFAMCRVSIGQTDKTYRNPEFMRQMADLARKHGVMLHTHLHPRKDEVELCLALYKQEPIDFLEENGWLGDNVWLAHATAFTPYYIDKVIRTKTGISHCPSSNMRLSYGLPPLPALFQAGAKLSVGVDGGSSNDSGDFLGELRETLLVHRIKGLHSKLDNPAGETSPYEVLKMGTRGGADVLCRKDIGSLEIGKAADIALFNIDRLDYAGAHDPLAALLLCGVSHIADTTIVNGKVLVRNGKLVLKDEMEIAHGANQSAQRIMKSAQNARA